MGHTSVDTFGESTEERKKRGKEKKYYILVSYNMIGAVGIQRM